MERKRERAAAKKARKAAAKKTKAESAPKEEKLMPQYTAKELKQAEAIRREQQRARSLWSFVLMRRDKGDGKSCCC